MTKDLTGQPIEGECGSLLEKYFLSDFRAAYRRYRGVTLPTRHEAFAERVENMAVRDEDVWVVSFPKTGTTWTQEMVWCIANDLDFDAAKEIQLQQRFPFLEHSCLFDYTDVLPRKPGLVLPPFVADSVGFVDKLQSPRFIKTHLPWALLPASIRNGEKKPKIIYVCRNAKDTCISYYHHCILLEAYTGNFDDFCKLFLGDSLCFAPFWTHISDFWKRRNEPNILFLTYEDMKKDLRSVVKKTCQFLGKSYSEEQLDRLCEHLSFNSMKNNPSVNYEAVVEINRKYDLIPADGEFMRKGTGGEWKGKMNDEMIDRFNKWIAKNMSDHGIDLNNEE
ncbi:UNVERIFIED_CONTAM: hypothetical protein PYX00_008005 [Menopon gallinae]|uniref:Sulfotransferase domain-containing protein n=1 Tax=Menopon gallinae TaxID=328185 RepID=A0AAW2HMK5_9NEOP